MTSEQTAEWGRHQRAAPSATALPTALVERILGIVNYDGWQGEIFRELQAALSHAGTPQPSGEPPPLKASE